MRVLRVSNKRELLGSIGDLDGNDAEVYVNLRPTLDVVDGLINQCPNLKKVLCPPSLYRQTSKRVFRALGDANIAFEEGGFRVGRPKKYAQETINQILSKRQDGRPAKVIADEMDIPLRTVYFYLKMNR
jgi:hypothetical protein